MIRFSHIFDKGQVFVRCPESDEEQSELDTLVQQVTYICSMTKNTGLWIVIEFQAGLRKVVVTSLEKKVEISSTDITVLQTEVLKRSQGDCNV